MPPPISGDLQEGVELQTFRTVDLRKADGQRISSLLAQPKRIGILLYLACSRQATFFPRDSLVSLFWPDFDEERARNCFRTALHYLRRSLGAGVIVTRSDGAVGLDGSRIRVDVRKFEEAIEAGSWSEAVQLFSGDFLESFHLPDCPEFESWAESHRKRLRRMACDGLWHLADLKEKEGEATEAVRLMRRSVALQPTNESLLQRLILLLGRTGDRAAAMQAYSEFAQRLRTDFGLDPSPETTALIAELRTGEGGRGLAPAPRPDPPPPERPIAPAAGSAARSSWRPALSRRSAATVALAVCLSLAGFGLARALPGEDPRRAALTATRVAVLPFSHHGPAEGHSGAAGLAHSVSARVAARSGWSVLGPWKLADLAPGHGDDETFDLTAAREIARSEGAGTVLAGSVIEVAGTIRVTATLMDVEGTSEPFAMGVADAQPGRLFAVVDSLVDVLLAEAEMRMSGTEQARPSPSTHLRRDEGATIRRPRAPSPGRDRGVTGVEPSRSLSPAPA